MIIVPAIFQQSYEGVVHELFMFEGLSDRVQIDICDGVFGMEKTWLPYKEKELPHGFSYEFDLMVKDWRKYLPRVISLGAKRVVMHIDEFTEEDISDMISMVMPHGIALGLSVSNDKNVPVFASRVKRIDLVYQKLFIQVMGIEHIGVQGQPFDETSLRRIMYLKDACKHIPIQVDGGMDPETLLKVKNRGATCAVVGHFLYRKGDSHEKVKKKFDTLTENFR
jgi:ribulose-phosphate 3-epimerase